MPGSIHLAPGGGVGGRQLPKVRGSRTVSQQYNMGPTSADHSRAPIVSRKLLMAMAAAEESARGFVFGGVCWLAQRGGLKVAVDTGSST